MSRGQNIIEKVIESANSHWILSQYMEVNKPEATPVRKTNDYYKITTTSPSQPVPQDVSNLCFKPELNKSQKGSKIRKNNEVDLGNDECVLKKNKLNFKDVDLFPFLLCISKSCKYDSILGLLYFVYKDFPDSLTPQGSRKDLEKILNFMDNDIYEAREYFKSFLISRGDTQTSFSATKLLKELLKTDYKDFNISFSSNTECTNKNCKTISSMNEEITISTLEEINTDAPRDPSIGVIKNYLLPQMSLVTTNDCGCNRNRRAARSAYSVTYKSTTTYRVKNLPKIMLINLENFYKEVCDFKFDQKEANLNVTNINTNSLMGLNFEEQLLIKHSDKEYIYSLKGIVYLEDSHFTLAYKNPQFIKEKYYGWTYHNGSTKQLQNNGQFVGNVRTFEGFCLNLVSLILTKKLPFILLYALYDNEI